MSPRFYRSLLELGGDSAISVGEWHEKEGAVGLSILSHIRAARSVVASSSTSTTT